MEEEKKFIIEEDDGEEIVAKKATLEEIAEKEKAEEEAAKPVLTKEEEKARDKKQTKLTAGACACIVGVVAIAGLVVALISGKGEQRVLPFGLDGITEADLAEEDLAEGEWYVGNQQAYGVPVEVIELSSLYDKPNVRGNAMMSFQLNDTVTLLGEVYNTKTNEVLNWYYAKSGDTKGYIKSDAVDFVWDDVSDEFLANLQPKEVEDTAEKDAAKEEFYKQHLVDNMKKGNNTANEKRSLANEYSELTEEITRLNNLIWYQVVIEEDEEGNEVEVPVEVTPEEMEQYKTELQEVRQKLEKVREKIDFEVIESDAVTPLPSKDSAEGTTEGN